MKRRPDVNCVPRKTLLWWPNQSDVMSEACEMYVGEYKCTQILVGNSEGKRSLRIPRFGSEDNVKIYIEI